MPTNATPLSPTPYIGRFAPSPTGPLHFGSLLCAVASYLDAKAHKGRWLVRIEDLDPPREQLGADQLILTQMLQHGLQWDGQPTFQSKRNTLYQQALDYFAQHNLSFPCICSRLDLAVHNGRYPGTCRQLSTSSITSDRAFSIRVKCDDSLTRFEDLLQGDHSENLNDSCGDFIMQRKDGLTAYQLAVVVDDNEQNISHVIRGSDLLSSTPRQIYLQSLLGFKPPSYLHIPVIVNEQGDKLSKQHGAAAIDSKHPENNLLHALSLLGQPAIANAAKLTCSDILTQATIQYQRHLIPAKLTIDS